MKAYHTALRTASAAAMAIALGMTSANAGGLLDDSTGDPHIDEQRKAELRWSGFYGGIAGTIGMSADDQTTSGVCDGGSCGNDASGNPFSDGDFLGSESVDGFAAYGGGVTGTLGYDHRVGRFIVGVFGDFTYSDDLWSTQWQTNVPGRDPAIRGGEYDRAYDWTAGVRFGKLINPNTLIYGLVGYSQVTGELPAGGVNSSGVPTFDAAQDVTFDGYTVGAGLESKVNNFLSWYVEGRWSQYESESVTFSEEGADEVWTLKSEPSEVKAMIGLKLRLLTE